VGHYLILRTQLKKKWKLFHHILSITGFGVNNDTGCIVAEPETWERLILSNKEVKQFQGKPLAHREILDDIFAGTAADGAYSQQPDDLSLVDPQILEDSAAPLTLTPGPAEEASGVEETAEDADADEDNEDGHENEQDEEDDLIQPRDAFVSDPIANRTLKRPRAITESESVMRKNLNSKRTVPGALSEMLGFLQRKEEKETKQTQSARERALRTLELEYKKLNDEQFNEAVELLSDDTIVEIFNSLKVVKRRDAWLRSKLAFIS
jgi:hypothetical protein